MNKFLFAALLAFAASPATAQVLPSGAQPIQGTEAPNRGYPVKTVATDGSGNAITPAVVAQGSTTTGQTGELVQCAVTTAAPTYTTATTNPFSCDTAGSQRVSITGSLPAGGNNIGAVYPQLASTSGAGTPLYSSYLLSSAATTNSNLILTGGRRLISGQLCNNNATVRQYVKFYNKATAPTVGTDTPLDIFTIQPNSCLTIDVSGFGQHFNLGLGVGITGAFAVADTTAVAAGDVTINILYL